MNPSSHFNGFQDTPLLKRIPKSISIRAAKTQEVLGYDELVHRTGTCLAAQNTVAPEPGSRVVVGVSDPIKVLTHLFAIWIAGKCAVLVNPKLAGDERQRVIASVSPMVWIDDEGVHVVEGSDPVPSPWPDAALVLMTSGTTGVPKGITHSLQTLETRLKLNVAEIGSDALSESLCPLPLFFGHGLIGNCLSPLYAGRNLTIFESPNLRDYGQLGALIDQQKITFLSSVPSFWRMVLRVSPKPQSPLSRVHVGSAPLPKDLWRDIEDWCGTTNVFNTYGMTETANWISGGKRPTSNADGYVGSPWGGEFRVSIDGQLQTQGRGEVAVQSPSLMLGMWGAEEAANEQDGFFLTGDIGELGADQSLRLVGRTKNEINHGGIKVLAEEVDLLLERHPDVAEACAFGVPDEIAGEVVGAVVRMREGVATDSTALIAWCRQHARREAVPSRLELVDGIEKNDRGKLARQAIQQKMSALWS